MTNIEPAVYQSAAYWIINIWNCESMSNYVQLMIYWKLQTSSSAYRSWMPPFINLSVHILLTHLPWKKWLPFCSQHIQMHFVFWFEFHWSLFPRVQLTMSQHWFRKWLGAEQAASHYLNQCLGSSLTHICGTRGRWVNSSWPMKPYGVIELGQNRFKQWLVARWHQAITWTYVDLSPLRSRGIHLNTISQGGITQDISLKIINIRLQSHLSGANEF